ncbi:MAG: hypothetical protein SGPRY_000479, partial [Prymnesium sp.]
MGYQVLHRFTEHRDFVYSLNAIGQYVVSGGGDGMVLLHDLQQGRLCYGLGANQAAVRCIHTDVGRLVCAGDDGSIICYDFGSQSVRAPTESSAGCCGAVNRPNSGKGAARGEGEKPASAAQQYAEKKRLAMERAAAIRAERKASQSSG